MRLINKIKELRKSGIRKKISNRLKEFKDFNKKKNSEWFSELCFCLLTSNSKAKTALKVQEKLGAEGFYNYCAEDVKNCIKECKHRFHNRKTEYIINARDNKDIKKKVQRIINEKGQKKARKWLADNIKGLGYKESSHFLRNTGYFNVAILDRHVIRLLHEYDYISEFPTSITKKTYLEMEEILEKIAEELGMSLAELDLYMWYMKTGRVLK